MPATRRFAFVTLEATGPDLRRDRIFRLSARIQDGSGEPEEIRWLADPAAGLEGAARESILERTRELAGLGAAELAGKSPVEEVFASFEERVAGCVLVGFEREPLLTGWRALRLANAKRRGDAEAVDAADPLVVGVADLARLVLPGRRSSDREALLRLAFGREAPTGELEPAALESLLGHICRAFLSRTPTALTIAASVHLHVVRELRRTDPARAAVLEAALDLLDRPSRWRTREAARFPAAAELVDGALSGHAGDLDAARIAFEEATPRFASDLEERFDGPPRPDRTDAPVPLSERARERAEALFSDGLPREIARLAGESNPARFVRPNQWELSRRIGEAFSRGDLLLVDAPTGTGKTMAYLVPAILWALEANVRVGITTYTVALQEQVFDRELQRALELLLSSGAIASPADCPRATVLKGRERYLCVRALRAAAPEAGDPPESWASWATAALFALEDPEGDLDRLPRRLPLGLERERGGEGALARLVREARCRIQCCEDKAERRHCGAWVARRRAERCHLVITNHAFVLRDPLFLRNLVADECDHLHAQARDAASIELSLRDVWETLESFAGPAERRPGLAPKVGFRGSRDPLSRVERALDQRNLFHSSPLGGTCAAARAAFDRAAGALARLEESARVYSQEREERAREEGEAEREFQRFATSHPAAQALRDARVELTGSLAELAGLATELAGSMDPTVIEGSTRLRARFRQASIELTELSGALQEWLPVVEGEARFDPACHYDLEPEPGRRGALVAKRTILLPHRWLAERVYPSMQSMVLLSASTWLGGSFDLCRGYLGLDLVERGSEGRDPREVHSHRSPPTFDYSRVLLAVPNDGPQASFATPDSRAPFDRYLEELLRELVERTRGGTLVLLTNLQQCRALGRALEDRFRARAIPFHWQGMEGYAKEELPRLFRATRGVLMGVDTFWYGVDFPGGLLETVVVAKLPFGAPDRYTRAQEAALGRDEYQRTIYLPEALSMFRQGVGRLMRRETDHGSVLVLDPRVLGRWKRFLRELPGNDPNLPEDRRLRTIAAPTGECVRELAAHAERLATYPRGAAAGAFTRNEAVERK